MSERVIGRTVTVVIDRPLGSRHPDYPETVYPVNYGFIPGISGGDGEAQDAYVLGVACPLARFTGRVAARIVRRDDAEEKWVVTPPTLQLSGAEILDAVWFIEQFFDAQVYFV